MPRASRKDSSKEKGQRGKARHLEEGPAGHVTEAGLWRYSVGTKGVNRVQVYERTTGATIYMEYRDEYGRHQEALKSRIGYPVTDRAAAIRIANELSREMEAKNNRRALESVFGPAVGTHTVEELLERLHADKASEWSPLHAKDQRRFQWFWFDKLHRQAKLVDLTPAAIEQTVRLEGDIQDWSPRTRQAYLRYIVDALYYAQRKLKWIPEQHNLSAVTIPAARSESKSYSEEEVILLLPALGQIDPRAAFVGEIAYQGGRRLNAIRSLPADAFNLLETAEGPVGVLQFPGVTDKARRSGEVALVGPALDAVLNLLGKPAVQASGLFCVAGDLDDPTPRKALTSEKALIDWLHDAEEAAGIPLMPGRAYHGLKRRFATVVTDRRAAAKQSGTNEETLERHYEQDDLAPKIEVARQLADRRRNGTRG